MGHGVSTKEDVIWQFRNYFEGSANLYISLGAIVKNLNVQNGNVPNLKDIGSDLWKFLMVLAISAQCVQVMANGNIEQAFVTMSENVDPIIRTVCFT